MRAHHIILAATLGLTGCLDKPSSPGKTPATSPTPVSGEKKEPTVDVAVVIGDSTASAAGPHTLALKDARARLVAVVAGGHIDEVDCPEAPSDTHPRCPRAEPLGRDGLANLSLPEGATVIVGVAGRQGIVRAVNGATVVIDAAADLTARLARAVLASSFAPAYYDAEGRPRLLDLDGLRLAAELLLASNDDPNGKVDLATVDALAANFAAANAANAGKEDADNVAAALARADDSALPALAGVIVAKAARTAAYELSADDARLLRSGGLDVWRRLAGGGEPVETVLSSLRSEAGGLALQPAMRAGEESCRKGEVPAGNDPVGGREDVCVPVSLEKACAKIGQPVLVTAGGMDCATEQH